MNDRPVVVIGAGGHALVVADVLRLLGHRLAGFIDTVSPERAGRLLAGAPILGGWDALDRLRQDGVRHVAVAIGDCAARWAAGTRAAESGWELTTACHPGAVVAASARVEAGAVIAAGAVVGPDAVVGQLAIINTSASVDHESVIGGAAHVGPGAHLGGRVRIGARAWIGIGAVVRDRVAIGDGTIVGAGAVVLSDLPGQVVAFGVPAAIRRPA
jgi:UDP-perosamine 4-acetyltransferase